MYLRRLAVPVAAIAVGAAFLPAYASAATAHHAPAAHGSTFATGAGAASGFKTFSSPASKSVRLQRAATQPVKGRTSATGKIIYAGTYDCAVEAGDGTQANPYCFLQDAVNAAAPGDTIDVSGSTGYFSSHAVVVKTSGISIVGTSDQSWIWPGNADAGKPALILDGVSDVTVSNLMLTATNVPSVEIVGSSGVTLDSDYIDQRFTAGTDTLTIDGASSNITVSRTFVDNGTWTAPGHSAISIASGAGNVTFASDLIAASGIKADTVAGLTVTGNTIQRTCAAAIDVEGASSGISIQNNLLEDANPQSDGAGYQSNCAANSQAWAPDVVISANASAQATADYNDFYVYGTDATDLYSWAGTAYATLSAFQTGTGQGAHDVIDSKQAQQISNFRSNTDGAIDAKLVKGSAAIGSANTSAPGALSSDFYGASPYTSRGAVEYVPVDPNLAVSLSAQNTSALGFSFQAAVTSTDVPLDLTIAWGDGTTSNTSFTGSNTYFTVHTYSKPGSYPISATVTDNQGDTVGNTVSVTTAGSDYTAYGPVRILDTRNGTGIGGTAAKVGPNGTVKLQVSGSGTPGSLIPAGITGVVLNLTVTNPTATGYLTAYPNQGYGGVPQNRPTSSNVDFQAGQTAPNLAVVPVGPDGIVDLYNGSGGTVNLIADVSGYFTQSAASGYSPLSPARLVDTRKGVGAPKAPVAAGGKLTVQIAGADGGQLPSGLTAVALNVTVVTPQTGGYLTLYPDGGSRPTASNLDFGAGQVIANAVIVPVGSDGKIDVYNGSGGSANVLVDVVGYYSTSSTSALVPVTPIRLLDTRTWAYGPITPGGYAYLWSKLSTTDPKLTAVVVNTTVTRTKGSGYETVSPDPNSLNAYNGGTAVFPTPPNVSTLDWSQGQTVPNLVQASTGQNGIVDYWNRSGGNMDLIVDQFGYYQAD